jgi:Glycosidases
MTTGPANAIGRIPIASLKPEVDGGLFPAKAYLGEVIPFGATVFREGHDAIGAELILAAPSGKTTSKRLEESFSGSDFFETGVLIDEIGTWSYQVLGFGDDFATWHHNATVKIAIAQDTELVILEALSLFSNASKGKNRSKQSLALIKQLILIFEDASVSAKAKLAAVDKPEMLAMFMKEPVRSLETLSASREVLAERKLAGCGSWYEFFPRSEGAVKNADGSITSGNFSTATKSLQRVKNMGFEVLYLPPIHPIGTSSRKGANNALTAKATDPGSPWAIGSQAGGHDVIHPELGDEKDFAAFVKAANKLAIEIAMDLPFRPPPITPG